MISGTAKGHKLKTVKGNTTRPTSDRVKESLFNIISGYLIDAEVLDLYAGTGNLGIEALSRGAKSAVFSDKSQECISVIKENLMHTKLSDKGLVIGGEASNILNKMSRESRKFDIIFLDPPYNKKLIDESLQYIVNNDLLKTDSIVVAERDIDDVIPQEIGQLRLVRDQKYGDTILSFYSLEAGLNEK